MGVPVVILGECLVDAIIKVFVVREDNVAADIVELEHRQTLAMSSAQREGIDAYEALIGDISAGQTTSLVAGIDNEP